MRVQTCATGGLEIGCVYRSGRRLVLAVADDAVAIPPGGPLPRHTKVGRQPVLPSPSVDELLAAWGIAEAELDAWTDATFPRPAGRVRRVPRTHAMQRDDDARMAERRLARVVAS